MAGLETVKLLAPPGVSAIGLADYQVRVGDDGHVQVPESVVAELVNHGFKVVEEPGLGDDELDDLRVRRDALKARLADLVSEEAAMTAANTDAVARLDHAKANLAAGDVSLDAVRKAERAVEEARSKSVLIVAAVATVMEELSQVARQVGAEESIRDLNRQRAESAPLIEEAAGAAEAFAAAVVMARDALAERAAILEKLRADFPRIDAPTLALADLGAALQAALAEGANEREPMCARAFDRLAEVLIAGPVIALQSAEAQRRLAAVKVNR